MFSYFAIVPSPTVSIYQESDSRTFITDTGNIHCNVQVPSISVPVIVSFKWFGPQGLLEGGGRYEFIQDDNNGQLIIHELNRQDNLTMYYCSVIVDVAERPTNYSDYVIPSITTSETVTLEIEGIHYDKNSVHSNCYYFFQNYLLLMSLLFHLVLLLLERNSL